MAAAAAALAPAWAAIRDGRHKAAAFATANAATAQPFLRSYSAAWVYATMATAGVSLLEKQRKYQEATEYLHQLLGGLCVLPLSPHAVCKRGARAAPGILRQPVLSLPGCWRQCHGYRAPTLTVAAFHVGGVCCAGRRGEWWTRLSIDTEHMGRVEEALEVGLVHTIVPQAQLCLSAISKLSCNTMLRRVLLNKGTKSTCMNSCRLK